MWLVPLASFGPGGCSEEVGRCGGRGRGQERWGEGQEAWGVPEQDGRGFFSGHLGRCRGFALRVLEEGRFPFELRVTCLGLA